MSTTTPAVNLCETQRRPGAPLPILQRLARTRVGLFFLVIAFAAPGLLPFLCLVPPVVLVSVLGIVSHFKVRRFMDLCIASWLTYMTIIFERILGIKTRLFGHRGRFKKRCVFIMNHVSHLDWLYFWTVVRKMGDLSTWKVVTKDNIRNLPLFGPCMQCGCLLFIKRNWENDEPEFRDKLDYFNSIGYPCQLLLFPEGGDLTYKSKSKSNSYADTKGLPHYEYCLHPRVKGFAYIVNKLRECGLDAVYDVTIGFPDTLPKTEVDFLSGVMPHKIDFHVKSYDNSDIPLNEEDIERWCQDRWVEKEQLLHTYYTKGTFDEDTATHHSNRTSPNSSKPTKKSLNRSESWGQGWYMLWLLTINLIPVSLIYVTWFVFGSSLFVIYCLLSLVFMVWLGQYSIGFDKFWLLLQRKHTNEYITRKRKDN